MTPSPIRRALLASTLAIGLTACAVAPVAPPPLQLDSARLSPIVDWLKADVEKKRYPGAVVLVARDGKVLLHEAVGSADQLRGVPMARDSIFPIASSTKLVTTVAALRLFEQNRLRIMMPVASYLPELANLRVARRDASGGPNLADTAAAARQPTVHDLMTHRAGFTYFFFPKNALRDRYRELAIDRIDSDAAPEMLRKLATLPLAFEPGTSFEYSIATDLLGHVVERITGKPLDQALNELVLEPLKMRDTSFYVSGASLARLARPAANDPDLWVFDWLDVSKPPKRFSGGAGMASTASDYARLLQMVLNEGELDGVRLLSPATVRWAMADQIGSMRGVAHPGDGYSWNLFNPVRTAAGGPVFPGSTGDIFWGGITGPRYFVDPQQRLIGVLFMLRPSERAAVHAELRAMVYGAMQPARP
ncbi:MAG TPA: serine hydrolase domain-containing protein [Burkholderiaceae bacterium]|nr:serine hydrolase domain-containing protein [Burkholderiaceae bacterium]